MEKEYANDPVPDDEVQGVAEPVPEDEREEDEDDA